jgi:hypothetical protein
MEAITQMVNLTVTDIDSLPFLMTPRQVATLGVKTVNTLQQERYEGRGIPFVKIGSSVRYRKTDVLDYINTHVFRSTREAKMAEVAA